MSKLDPKQQLAVREILEGLRAATNRIHPETRDVPDALVTQMLDAGDVTDPYYRADELMAQAIRAARELDAAH